jgi:hypothetical protein
MSDIPGLKAIDTPVTTDVVEVNRIASGRVQRFQSPLNTLLGAVAETISAVKTFTAAAIFGAGFSIDTGTKTVVAAAGAATLNKLSGKVTTEDLTTAQDASYTLTLTNTSVAAADIVLVSVASGTNTQGTTVVTKVTPAAGSVVIIVTNKHATAQALNGTLVISYVVIKA